jgi:hypothetical protein
MTRLLLSALILAGLCQVGQQEKSDFNSLLQLAPKLIRLQNQFERTVPAGMAIEAREVSPTGTSGQDFTVPYNMYLKGAPSGGLYREIRWPVDKNQSIPGSAGITLNSEGEMICAGRTPEQCHSSVQLDAPSRLQW